MLLLDDDPYCNQINTFLIEQQQSAKSIVTFEAALDALQYLERLVLTDSYEAFPDVILLDLHMGNLDRWGFLDRFSLFLPRYRRKARIYILTSSILASDRKAATQHADVTGYIEKPFTTSELNYIASSQTCQVLP